MAAGCTVLYLGVLSASPASASAQAANANVLGLPPVVTAVSSEARPISAAEARHHVEVEGAIAEAGYSFRSAHYPLDSLRQVAETHAAEWLTRLERSPIRGLQRDPAGVVGVFAGHEAYAKQQIAARLATPGLSLADRAFTLVTAVGAFGNRDHPERFPTAEAYLTQLDALGSAAAASQFEARQLLVVQYYWLGRSDDVIRLGVQALRRLLVLPYLEQRPDGMWYSPSVVYFKTVESLAGRPNGRPLIDSLTAILQATIEPPAALLAQDSTWAAVGAKRKGELTWLLELVRMLGTVRPPIVGNYWVNRPTHDSAAMSVADGTIHIVVHGSVGCDGCITGLYAMERIKQQFPEVHPVGLFSTFGFWGNRLVEPDDEAERLNTWLTKQLKVTIPVAIWKGAKYSHEDGGYRADFEDASNLLVTAYPRISKPSVYVVDGHGRLRRYFAGMNRETEQELVRTITFLEREAAQAASQAGSTTRAISMANGFPPRSSHGS